MSKEFSRRQFLKGVTLTGIALTTAAFTEKVNASRDYMLSESPLLEENVEQIPFMVGDINYGIEGKGNGPLTKLTLQIPGIVRKDKEFILETYPRLLSPEDKNPAGNYWENDNPTYWNDGQVVVQTIHSGNVWGKDLPANPLRVELQEKTSLLRWNNVDSVEGSKRRARFKDAPFVLEQGENFEKGKILSIAHITPLQTIDLEKAYAESDGMPVNLTEFSDYEGPELDSNTDVIYFYCTEPYLDEEQRNDTDYYSQGRDLLIVRINQ